MRTLIPVASLLFLMLGSVWAKLTVQVPATVLYERIESVRERAAGIKIDGKVADWEGIPVFRDQTDDAGRDASRDIIRAAIAPREQDLIVMIQTSGKPVTSPYAYGFRLDGAGGSMPVDQGNDLLVALARERMTFCQSATGGIRESVNAEVAIDEVLEVRIPYAELPMKAGEPLSGPQARPWLRVYPYSWNPTAPASNPVETARQLTQPVDYGPAVASYRLLPTPYRLDPAPPRPDRANLSVELPLNGKWVIGQGSYSTGTHNNQWAYDLWMVDRTMYHARIRTNPVNADHYCWNQPVYAPTQGRVVLTRSDLPDEPVRDAPLPQIPANLVNLEIAPRFYLALIHFRQNSVPVQTGATVPRGALVGRIGFSGIADPATVPRDMARHLHLGLFRDLTTVPMALSNVRVSLNPSLDDPWALDVAHWLPSEGLFVQRLR